MISKSWSTSKKRAALYRQAGPLAEFCLQLFPLLVVHSDDYGRFDGDPETVKLKCDPGSPRSLEEFEAALGQLQAVGLVHRYTVAGQPWLQIEKFDEHQPGLLSKRTTPKSPAPQRDTESAGNSGNSVPTKPNSTEVNGTKQEMSAEASSAPPATRGSVEARVFLEFPVVGPQGPTWTLSEDQVSEWARLFPGLNVRAESRKALAWVHANPGRRKTARGMAKFLVAWFTRAVDSGRGQQSVPRGSEQDPRREWTCPDDPPCEAGTTPWRCHQRHELEKARRARAAS
jgi:hypothetical protein